MNPLNNASSQPANPYGQDASAVPAAAPQAPAAEPKKKKKGGCLKWGVIGFAGLVVLGMLGVGGEDNTSKEVSAAGTTSDAAAVNAVAAPATPGLDEANPANVGDTVKMDRMEATVTSFAYMGETILGDTEACANVSFVNTSDKELNLNAFDWDMTDPNGVSHDMTFSPNSEFEPVSLKPGGNYSGTLCFQTDGAPGDYQLRYRENFLGGIAYWKGVL